MRAGFEAAKSRQPSICYLLNLEKICGADADEEGQSSDSYHLSCIIADAMSEMADADEVTFIATASERDALCKPLREQDVFEYDFEVRKPNMDARKDVILSYAAHRGVDCDEQVADAISQRTDGFDVADLRIIMDRAIESEIDRALSVRANESHRAIGSRIRVSSSELKDALKGYTPIDQLSLAKSDGPDGEGIDEYVDGFDSIGGFDEVKQNLEDAIALPARHPKIFSQCPLRLPTGVLLYGPPGSGKSAMAKAAIVNAGLRSITIKGPELFSKYYGESEATLRKLFKRAEDAAPCALFFDEFESLAPRRGGTDGGVTDRMVNQFLTLLDGVESLVGVFVICATSRPDVVDPALLRPGRLDHLLYLPMPDAIARAKIVRTLTREIKVAPGVDLVAIAESERMESFSGADLAAFVSECANVAATRVLKTYTAAVGRGEDVAEPNAPPTIEPHDVVEALKRSRASLSQETLLFYKRVHEDFRNSRRASGVGGDAQTFASQ
jgi:peroxin-1